MSRRHGGVPRPTPEAKAAVTEVARRLLAEHGLADRVELRWGRARTQLGSTRFRADDRVVITLSEVALALRGVEDLHETFRHELAHVLAGPGEGHGARWREIAVEVGAEPRARSSRGPAAPHRWSGVCGHGCEWRRYRLDRRMRRGRRCAAHGAAISWQRLD